MRVNSPFAVNVEGGFEDDGYSGKASQRHEGHEQVGGGEKRPGFHLVVLTEVSIAPFSRKVKFGKPTEQVGQTVRMDEFGCCG